MTERSPKICLISPTENLARRAKPLIMRRGMDVRVEVAELEAAVSLAKRLLTQNDYLFISRRGTRDLLRKSLNIQVVNIPGEASDYIPAIQQLRHERGLIAFFSFEEEISNELRTICYLLDLKMKHYCFSDSLSCQSAVQQAVADGAAWGLGGIVSERFAKLYDLPYLRVESSDASILHALDIAQQLYVTQQENARQQEQLQIQLERYQNILDYTHDAIVAIDENGRISTTNQIAEQMLRPAQPPFAGQPIEEVLPNTHLTSVLQTGEAEIGQMMNIHGTLVSTNRVPIRVGGQVKGVVATFQDIKTLQTAERNIRIKLHEKGLVAKYRFSDILGQSPAILEAKHLSENFADGQYHGSHRERHHRGSVRSGRSGRLSLCSRCLRQPVYRGHDLDAERDGLRNRHRILQGAGGSQVSGKPYPGQLQRPSHPYRAGDPLQILMLSPMRGRCANAFPDHSPPF